MRCAYRDHHHVTDYRTRYDCYVPSFAGALLLGVCHLHRVSPKRKNAFISILLFLTFFSVTKKRNDRRHFRLSYQLTSSSKQLIFRGDIVTWSGPRVGVVLWPSRPLLLLRSKQCGRKSDDFDLFFGPGHFETHVWSHSESHASSSERKKTSPALFWAFNLSTLRRRRFASDWPRKGRDPWGKKSIWRGRRMVGFGDGRTYGWECFFKRTWLENSKRPKKRNGDPEREKQKRSEWKK